VWSRGQLSRSRAIIALMWIVDFEIVEHLRIRVGFEDGARLEIRFLQERLKGTWAPLAEESEFLSARALAGTVAWQCGASIDGQLARIKADEGPMWTPAA